MIEETPSIKVQTIQKIVSQMANKVKNEKDYLTKLDSDIGDADHGVNLDIGFQSVIAQLKNSDTSNMTIKNFVKKVGFILLDKIGGASGPLYGSFFMQLGNSLDTEKEVSFDTFFSMLDNGVIAIEKRGKVKIGEKTMFDVIRPTVDFLLENKDTDRKKLLLAAKKIANNKFNETINLFPKKGRAARLGEKAVGHADPGAASIQFLIDIICDTLIDL